MSAPSLIINHRRNNAWNIRRLVYESFAPRNQWTILLYYRLPDFLWICVTSGIFRSLGAFSLTAFDLVFIRTTFQGKRPFYIIVSNKFSCQSKHHIQKFRSYLRLQLTLKVYQSLDFYKIYYSHFIFEVMYHCSVIYSTNVSTKVDNFPLYTLQILTPWKVWGLGITGSLQRKHALSMEKGCKNHKEILCMLWINPVIFIDCGETTS